MLGEVSSLVLAKRVYLLVYLMVGQLLGSSVPIAWAQVAPATSEVESYSGIFAAAAEGDAEAVRRLVAKDPSLSKVRDGHNRTPLIVSAHFGHREVLRVLARAGADLNAKDERRYDIITIAAVRDDVSYLDLALELGGSARSITSPYDGTALIAAAHLGHDGVVRSLIRAGAPLDHVNNLGWTAVIEAIVLGDGGRRHQETLRALIDAGADPSIADRDGMSPLALARARGYDEMVAILEGARRSTVNPH